MRLGMMNDPRYDVCDEARWAAENGLDFLDLTIEGPGAALEQIHVPALHAVLRETGLGVVGHTAWFLPFASPVARVRQAAVESIVETFDTFAALGARRVNVHIVFSPALFDRSDSVRWNAESFAHLAERAAPYGLQVMVEHPPSPAFSLEDIGAILDGDARLGFHLDVGHANVGNLSLATLLETFGARLAHVHLSDNRGRSDDHLPLGVGNIDWPDTIRLLKQSGYDDTVTLEVFGPDRDYLLLSARKVRGWWEAA